MDYSLHSCMHGGTWTNGAARRPVGMGSGRGQGAARVGAGWWQRWCFGWRGGKSVIAMLTLWTSNSRLLPLTSRTPPPLPPSGPSADVHGPPAAMIEADMMKQAATGPNCRARPATRTPPCGIELDRAMSSPAKSESPKWVKFKFSSGHSCQFFCAGERAGGHLGASRATAGSICTGGGPPCLSPPHVPMSPYIPLCLHLPMSPYTPTI